MPCGERFVGAYNHTEFTGHPGDLKVRVFLDAVNSVGRLGSWIEGDKKYAAKLKLGGIFI
jgi:hypothetical protein